MWRLLVLSSFVSLCATACPAEELRPESDSGPAPHLAVVRRYADALIEHGTDVYGRERSGMLLSLMRRSKPGPFDRMPQAPNGVRPGDRVTTHGSNVNVDQNLYRTLYALSEVTGDPKYARAADSALSTFLMVSPSPATGLFAWGEHLCWDLKADAPGTHEVKRIHEPKRPTVLFDKFHELNPDTTIAYCDGLWEHQLYTDKSGKKEGNFSRHAAYDRHDPRPDFDFPKEGGYFIHDWARAYGKTRENRFLDYIDLLASRYERKAAKTRHGLVEFDSVRGFADTSASLSLAIDCSHAAEIVPAGPVRDRLARLAATIDTGLLGLDHDPAGRGFVQFVTVADDYRPYDHKGNGGYSFVWNMKYGRKTTAMLGLLCYRRSTQLPDGPARDRYRKLALQAADRYLATDPDPADRVWPVEFGTAIFLQLAAHEVGGAKAYLDRARHYAAAGVATYWPDDAPLPKADAGCDHYENITGADTLALALLKLHATEDALPIKIDISDIDR